MSCYDDIRGLAPPNLHAKTVFQCDDVTVEFLLCVFKETNEKLALKMCRLELTPRNKDRWSREIQIMKKSESFLCIFYPFTLSYLLI